MERSGRERRLLGLVRHCQGLMRRRRQHSAIEYDKETFTRAFALRATPLYMQQPKLRGNAGILKSI